MAKTIITAALTGAITPRGYDIPERLVAAREEAAEKYGMTYFAAQGMGQK